VLLYISMKPHLYESQAYFKMQNVLIDDRRIWVDLCVISNQPFA
jgi:hypothetical protein